LHVACCMLHAICCLLLRPLHNACGMKSCASCMLSVARCMSSAVRCTLSVALVVECSHVVCCTLHAALCCVACCPLHGACLLHVVWLLPVAE
jgi:hypothetical protein